MRVFVVQRWGDHEYNGVWGVFATRKEAESHLRNDGKAPVKDDPGYWENSGSIVEGDYEHYSIESYIV